MAFNWLLALFTEGRNVFLKGQSITYFNTKEFYAVFRIDC